MNSKSYIAAITRDKGTGKFEVMFPDLDGCLTFGETIAQAEERAKEALEGWIETMIDTKQAIPDASDLQAIVKASPKAAVFVRIAAPTTKAKAIPVTISLNERVLERIDAAAESVGLSRSSFIAHSALVAAGAKGAAEKVKDKSRKRAKVA